MKSKYRTITILGALGVGCCSHLFLVPANAQKGEEQDPVIKKIAQDWKRRLERVKTIKYRASGTTVYTKDYLDQVKKKGMKWESKDVTLKRSFAMILDFQGKQQRTEDD